MSKKKKIDYTNIDLAKVPYLELDSVLRHCTLKQIIRAFIDILEKTNNNPTSETMNRYEMIKKQAIEKVQQSNNSTSLHKNSKKDKISKTEQNKKNDCVFLKNQTIANSRSELRKEAIIDNSNCAENPIDEQSQTQNSSLDLEGIAESPEKF